MQTLESLSEEVKGYFTWESLAKRFTERTGKRVSCTTVYNSCKISRLAPSVRALCTLPQRNRRGEKIGVGKAACRLHLDGDGKLAISERVE